MCLIIIPALNAWTICYTIGTQLTGIKISVYNPESLYSNATYSKMYLDQINPDIITIVPVNSREEGIQNVRRTETWASLSFDANYSNHLGKKLKGLDGLGILNFKNSFDNCTMHLESDMTELPAQKAILEELLNANQKFLWKLLFPDVEYQDSFSLQKIMSQIFQPYILPVDPPVYGSFKPDFREFTTPALVLQMIFSLATTLTTVTFVLERKEGLLERTLVAGVKIHHILMSHILFQLLIIMAQSSVMLFIIFYMFEVNLIGSIYLMFTLTFIQGFIGMSWGLLVSAACYEEQAAVILGMASLFFNFFMSGVIWPIEVMPRFLRKWCYMMPLASAIKSARSVMSRGFDLTDQIIYEGLIQGVLWITVLNLCSLAVFAFRQRQ